MSEPLSSVLVILLTSAVILTATFAISVAVVALMFAGMQWVRRRW